MLRALGLFGPRADIGFGVEVEDDAAERRRTMTELLERSERREREERKRFDAIWWAGVLIWIGLALGAEYLDILPDIGDTSEWWPWIFVGVGPWSLALNLYRMGSTTAPNPSTSDWTWTVIFMAVAIGTLADIGGEIVGAAALVAIGLMVLIRAVSSRD
jgi:hypothetical protein